MENGPIYTKEDFYSTKPYEDIERIKDPFQRDIALRQVAECAVRAGFKGFRAAFKKYHESQRLIAAQLNPQENLTDFEDSDYELFTGSWHADDSGIYRYGPNGQPEYACTHPIYPVERLRNIDTGELKVRLAFRRGLKQRKSWNEIVVDFDTISNAKNIVALSRIGISVQSGKKAQNMVDYIGDVMDLNYDSILERKSVSRLGWNEEGFSPYIGDVVFDGNDAFGRIFQAIRQEGDYEAWKEEVRRVRKFSLIARIVLAASFASVLVGPMGCSPFFVHLWGMASETGKTVSQMVAASVWGEPTKGGEYFKTFKSTTVGFEFLAGFLRSLPLIIDELQLAKDAKGKVIFNVYELESGTGKLRGTKTLGIASTPHWANCFITSGETPITSEQDGAGALNRVIEVECLSENKVIEDGHRTAEAMKLNYGHAGRDFIEHLCMPGVMEQAKEIYAQLFKAFVETKATEKQAHSASLLILADRLATMWIFEDDCGITVDELAEFLKSKRAISAAQRGYDYICDWVAQNGNKMQGSSEFGEVYGDIGRGEDAGYVYIIRSVFNKACADAGISAKALLSQLKSDGLIKTRGKNLTRGKRINSILTECVVLKMREEDPYEDVPWDSVGPDS